MTESQSSLDDEIELITASLLPAEELISSESGSWPRTIDIASADCKLSLRVRVDQGYPSVSSVRIEIRADVGREEAEEWREWTEERMKEWQASEECPLYQLLTAHFLPLLAPSSPSPSPSPDPAPRDNSLDRRPHHALLTSHHLLAPSKRKDLQHLSSKLSLVGFAKTGHPGIMYAIGDKRDLEEWVKEVKTWQWLALRVRITPEPVKVTGEAIGAIDRDKMARGDWTELTKINEALEWLHARERENILTDFGIGGG